MGLISLTEPDGGSRIVHSLLEEKVAGHEPVKPSGWLVQEAEQTSPV